MKFEELLTVAAMLGEIGARIRRQRLQANITQAALAGAAGVSVRTVARLERGEDVQLSVLIKCLNELGLKENLEYAVPDIELRPSDYLRQAPQKKRASKPRKQRLPGAENGSSLTWKWGDEA